MTLETNVELFNAVRLIEKHCKEAPCTKKDCCLYAWCVYVVAESGSLPPYRWPDPEEGGGEDGDE